MMLTRRISKNLQQRLDESPAVVLIGPRQCGKTTLALQIAEHSSSLYLDLESEQDRAKLSEPELYLPRFQDRLVLLDEVHRAPGLFPVLRGLIDRARRQNQRTGLYLLLGSASLDLLKQSGESLAGRVSLIELAPFDILEILDAGINSPEDLWLRGGFPDSLLAQSESASLRWRLDFIRSYLERDIPQFGPRIAAEMLRRFWTMLAHDQGSILNVARLARSLAVDVKTVASYIDLLCDLLLVRRLPSWHSNTKKRLVKSPKIYLRDSGLLHALLGLGNFDDLQAHPIVGASWEGFVIEQLLTVMPENTQAFHYRSAGGAEIDLLLRFPTGELWAIEIKRSLSPKARRGFYSACEDLQPERRFVVYPGDEAYPLRNALEVVPLDWLAKALRQKNMR